MRKMYEPQGRSEQGWVASQEHDEGMDEVQFDRHLCAVVWRLYAVFLVVAIYAAIH